MSAYTGPTQPSYQDVAETLIRKWAASLYAGAISTSPNLQPQWEDNRVTLLRKIAQMYYNSL